jgi:DNA-binding NarL/FixJ family response regulator
MIRLLLVDDNDEIRRSVRTVLAEAIGEVTVGEAGNAGQALTLLDRESWQIVVLDLSLPDRSGIETLREIRRRQPALPVLVMSFHSASEYAAAARAAGAADYVAKGSAPAVIASAVRRALGISSADADRS